MNGDWVRIDFAQYTICLIGGQLEAIRSGLDVKQVR